MPQLQEVSYYSSDLELGKRLLGRQSNGHVISFLRHVSMDQDYL